MVNAIWQIYRASLEMKNKPSKKCLWMFLRNQKITRISKRFRTLRKYYFASRVEFRNREEQGPSCFEQGAHSELSSGDNHYVGSANLKINFRRRTNLITINFMFSSVSINLIILISSNQFVTFQGESGNNYWRKTVKWIILPPFYFGTIWPQNWIKQAGLHCSKQKLMLQEIVELRFFMEPLWRL